MGLPSVGGECTDEPAAVQRWYRPAMRRADPWLVAQLIIQSTHALSPLVAVQPVYMSPYAAAEMVATLGHLHGRRVDLNMVDIQRSPGDLHHTNLVFERAGASVAV